MAAQSEITRFVVAALERGLSVEHVLQALRTHGYSKSESIVALAEAQNLDLADATLLVPNSSTWSDRAERDARFNNQLWDQLESLGERQPDGSIDLTRWLGAE